ncbi:hypothetical protein LCGC14_0341260 [marine sediment metagenome]|uniref:Glycosyltransferase 2-like domain-containing protein n=1 Tax=marine sediment metagenome TaxID=412755 RepID=A0A0F9TJA7_9ZZZZ
MLSISVIIPTRNEKNNIKKLLSQIMPYGYEVIVVDDSDDNTPEIARKSGANVIKGRGLGLAQAVLDGIDATDSDFIIVMDSDLQHPSSLLPQIVANLKRHDLVVVTKHTKEAMSELSWWRKLQSNLAVWAAHMIVPAPVSDPMTGYFGIRRKCLEGIPRGEYTLTDSEGLSTKMIGLEGIGFKIGLELFAKAKWVSHVELPMSFARREAGVSKGTRQSLQKHLKRLYQNSLNYVVELPKGSEEYHAFYEGTETQKEWKQAIALLLKTITEDLKPQRILDVGCGSSPNLNYMFSRDGKVGIDVNEKALEYMKGHSDAEFRYGSVMEIPFPDNSFDIVTCIEVLEHLYPKDIDKALMELVRVLKPNGHLILATPNYASRKWRIVENAQKLLQSGAWTSDHHTKFTHELLTGFCNKYGLREIRYDGVMHNMDMLITYKR